MGGESRGGVRMGLGMFKRFGHTYPFKRQLKQLLSARPAVDLLGYNAARRAEGRHFGSVQHLRMAWVDDHKASVAATCTPAAGRAILACDTIWS